MDVGHEDSLPAVTRKPRVFQSTVEEVPEVNPVEVEDQDEGEKLDGGADRGEE
jgi:hypothetical protein